jgi:hypothetical protein
LPFISFTRFSVHSNGRYFWTVVFFLLSCYLNFKVPHYHYWVQIMLWLEWYLLLDIIGLEDFSNAADLWGTVTDNLLRILRMPTNTVFSVTWKRTMKVVPPHATSAHGGTDIASIILNLDEGWVVSGRVHGPVGFTHRDSRGAHCKGSLVGGAQSRMDVSDDIKTYCFCRKSNPGLSSS